MTASALVFDDISSEEWREYRFPSGARVHIAAPLKLAVSVSGGHRIEDAAGNGHYVPSGWVHLCWKVKSGRPVFVL